MRKFYLEYKGLEFLQQLVREIPWGHNLLIISKVPDPKAREYYLKITRDLGLSRNMLTSYIKNQSYEHQVLAKKQHNFQETLPTELAEQADQTMKDIYTSMALP